MTSSKHSSVFRATGAGLRRLGNVSRDEDSFRGTYDLRRLDSRHFSEHAKIPSTAKDLKLVEFSRNSSEDKKHHSEWSKSRIGLAPPTLVESTTVNAKHWVKRDLFSLQKPLAAGVLQEGNSRARNSGFLSRGATPQGEDVHQVFCHEVLCRQMEIGGKSERVKFGLAVPKAGGLRRSDVRSKDVIRRTTRDATLEPRSIEGLLPRPVSRMAQTIHGVQTRRKILLVDRSIPRPGLCTVGIHINHSAGGKVSTNLEAVHPAISRRFLGYVEPGGCGKARQIGNITAERSRIYDQLGDQISSRPFSVVETPWSHCRRWSKNIRSTNGQNQRHPHSSGCYFQTQERQGSNFSQINRKDYGDSTCLGSGKEGLLAFNRQSLSLSQIGRQVRLESAHPDFQGSLRGTLVHKRSPFNYPKQTVSRIESVNGFFRCSGGHSTRLGLSYSSIGSQDSLGKMDHPSRSEVSEDPSQRILRCYSGSKVSTARIQGGDSNGFKDSKETSRSQWRSKIEARSVGNSGDETVELVSEEGYRGGSFLLDQIRGQSDCGLSLPTRGIREARASQTMVQYDKIFEEWNEWLHSVQLHRTPQSLWIYLDQLRYDKKGRSARKIRSAILYSLKISGEFYNDFSGLSFKDERLKLIALGVEKQCPKEKHTPKLPIRWFHLSKLVEFGKRDDFWLRDVSLLIIGLFAFMRAAEIASLSYRNFRFEEDNSILVTFKRLKSDIDAQETTIKISNLSGFNFNMLHLLTQFLQRNKDNKYLFLSSKGKKLNADSISKILNLRLGRELRFKGKFSSHSLRVGAACFASECGKSETAIKSLGGWKSNAFLRYIRDIVTSFNVLASSHF